MIEVLADWFLFGIKGLGMLYLAVSAMMALVVVKNYLVSKNAGNYVNRKLAQFRKKELQEYPFHINPQIAMIVQVILQTMQQTLGNQRQKTRDHLFRHSSILFRTIVRLPIRADDPNLYYAIDVVKQMFYRMYGTYRNNDIRDVRNHLDMKVHLADGTDVSHLTDGVTIEQALWNLKIRGYPASDDDRGMFIVINMSIATPLTSKNYSYRRYCT